MARQHADFYTINFHEQLGDTDRNTPYKFVGNQSTRRTFKITDEPVGTGYVNLQVMDVDVGADPHPGHQILVNGTPLPGLDIPMQRPPSDTWRVWTDYIPAKILTRGENTIQIARHDTPPHDHDELFVRLAVIHWREKA